MSIAWDTFFKKNHNSSTTGMHRSTGKTVSDGDMVDRRFVLLQSGTHSGLHHDTLCSMDMDEERETVGEKYEDGGRFYVDAAGVIFPIISE